MRLKVSCTTRCTHRCELCNRGYASLASKSSHQKYCDGIVKPKTNLTIGDARALAQSRGGMCLSETYTNSVTPLKWCCGANPPHIWDATFNKVKNCGNWCPRCNCTLITIEEAKELAATRGGLCLSEKFQDGYVTMKWQCAKGHLWSTSFDIIKYQKSWCPDCANDQRRKYSIEDAIRIAEQAGGHCLSTEYKNTISPLIWQCNKVSTHIWKSSFASLAYYGTWCPRCRVYKTEDKVRQIFEKYTGKAFPETPGIITHEPLWRLDGYCRELGLAFEYHGEQHYRYVPMFHRIGPEALVKQQKRDAAVEAFAAGWPRTPFVLIVIPYTMKLSAIETMVKKELYDMGIPMLQPAQ